jgi:hypothetical protein
MANYNLIHTVKIDEVGKEIGFTCYDADGDAVDLTNYTVTMSLAKGSTVITSAAACSKRTQSGATLGQCYHTWTAATIPNTAGDYKGELKLVYGSNVLYWPCDKNGERTKFTVRVQTANE